MRDLLTVDISTQVDCLCDFTYNFYWQHNGSELDPSKPVEGQVGTHFTYRDLVEHLISGKDVRINGNAGSRLGFQPGR